MNRFNILLVLMLAGYQLVKSEDILGSNYELYKEIGCAPLIKDEHDRTLSYNCAHLSERDKTKCYYKGKVYSVEQKLPDSEYRRSCLTATFCGHDQFSGLSKFIYAIVDCFPANAPCYTKYESNSCCGITYCPGPEETVHTCAYKDKTYKEYEIIYRGDDKQCICTKNFDGTLNGEWCVDLECEHELKFSEYLHNFDCAPVYYDGIRGCAIEWICHNQTGTPESIADSDEKLTTVPIDTSTKKHTPELKCKFGPLELRVDQKLSSVNNKCVQCSCNVPPYLTCTKDGKCDRAALFNESS